MPFKNDDRRRAYDRERKRLERSGVSNLGPSLVQPEIRVRVIEDVFRLLDQAIALAQTDERAKGIEKARALGSLASLGLRAVEARKLADRVDALERVLKSRNEVEAEKAIEWTSQSEAESEAQRLIEELRPSDGR
jgi:hypothetical protein